MVWVYEWVMAILFQGKSSEQADIKMTNHSVQQAAQSENINGLLGSGKQPNQLVSVLKGKNWKTVYNKVWSRGIWIDIGQGEQRLKIFASHVNAHY